MMVTEGLGISCGIPLPGHLPPLWLGRLLTAQEPRSEEVSKSENPACFQLTTPSACRR